MLVPILTDGNCFLRAIAAFLNDDIKNANRNENGRINNKYLRDKETNFTKFLRYSCVNVIETEKSLYRCASYYDDYLYENIEDRINKMYKTIIKDKCTNNSPDADLMPLIIEWKNINFRNINIKLPFYIFEEYLNV